MGEDFDNHSGNNFMLRILVILLVLASCSMGAVKTGGDKGYVYEAARNYTSPELSELSVKMIETSKRDPHVGTLDALFSNKQKPLKRIGIVIFETEVQPTRGGLAGSDAVYLSEQGKQLVTEKFLTIWEQSIKMMSPELDYVTTSRVKKSPPFHKYGLDTEDYVNAKRTSLAPDDIFFMESGKKTTTVTTLNARGMRDMSFVLVPAYDMMAGPKWSEHNKHFLNDVAKDLKLDALLIIKSEAFWTAAHQEKNSGEHIPEELVVKVKASTLVPLSDYHARLEKLNIKETPGLTLCYRAYESEVKTPVVISVSEENKNFETIEAQLVGPMFKTYKDLAQMTLIRVTEDMKKTW
jgi:hypothetical protein